MRFLVNAAIAIAVIVGATWLSKRYPTTAGFVTALPITTMLVLILGHLDGVGLDVQTRFARSLFVGIPLSMTFLIPFAVAPRLGLSFWSAFAAGLGLLACAYAFHRWVFGV